MLSRQSGQGEVVPPDPLIVDLFAGPGGWSEGLKALGYRELGIEWDEAACATARAAGHERLRADVAALDPTAYPCWGLIASPPCQAWSMAGKGGGRRDIEHVIACAMEMAAGHDTRAEHGAKCEDSRSMLVVEPLRWVRLAEPAWIALEQVPPVLELWTLFAQILDGWGFSTWAGVLEAERYGVPQTRERAVLMASRTRTVHPPIATHQRYVKGEPQRHDVTLEGEILPWVSMAEALGWTKGTAAYRLAPGLGKGVPVWVNGNQANAARRAEDEPAPTLHFGHALNSIKWVHERPAPTVCGDARGLPEPKYRKGGERQWNENAVRVTIEQAAILQSFRPDYPWQGSRPKQFEQVGNAVPPLLARAVLAELVPANEAEVRDAA